MPTTLAAQFTEGTEYNAIIADGAVYVEVIPALGDSGSPAADTGGRSARSASSEEEVAAPAAAPARSGRGAAPAVATGVLLEEYTDKELMDIETKEIKNMLEKAGLLSFIPDDGKKETNAKLRTAYIAAFASQQGGNAAAVTAAPSRRGAAEVAAPAISRRGAAAPAPAAKPAVNVAEISETISAVLADLDTEKVGYTVDMAIDELAALGGDEKQIASIMNVFMTSPKTPPAVFAAQLLEEITGEGEAAPAPAPAVSRRGAAAPAPAPAADPEPDILVPADYGRLKIGDKVGVFWANENGFFDGTVEKVDRKGIYVKYDDGTADYINPANNTEIELY